MNFQDLVNLPCRDLPRRRSRRIEGGIGEALYAETAAFKHFEDYFERLYRGGLVVSQLNYKSLGSQDRGVRFILDALRVHFRNWWSPRNLSREGGFRKPDGLGISPGGRVVEIIEVKPFDRYAEAAVQLDEMIERVEGGLRAYYEEKCSERGTSLPFDPSSIVVRGSPWRPRGMELVVTPADATWKKEKAWICFKPTIRLLPDGSTPRDGVILYEIHSLQTR